MTDGSPGGTGSIRYDPETDTYRMEFDYTAVRPHVAVVTLVAHACGTNPTEIDPLYDAIDPKSIDRICGSRGPDHGGSDRSVTFPYCGHEVTVECDGLVEARPLTPDAGDGATAE